MSSRESQIAVYLDVLFGHARPYTLVEVRWRSGSGMGRRFFAANDRGAITRAVLDRATVTDVYVGVLPRWRTGGDRGSVVSDGRTVWVDLDIDAAARALEPVDPAPTVIVASGTPGHLHAYWSLARAATPQVIERANRRLAWALGGDLASTDAARILRPPSSLHHRRGGEPVRLLSASTAHTIPLGSLIGRLPDPPGSRTHPRPRTRRRASSPDRLLAVAPERYVSVLTGQPVGRSRKVCCPLHDDRTASLHVYPDPERGWFCFGCRRGGTVYDLAAGIWRLEPRGEGFRALRNRLQQMLA